MHYFHYLADILVLRRAWISKFLDVPKVSAFGITYVANGVDILSHIFPGCLVEHTSEIGQPKPKHHDRLSSKYPLLLYGIAT